MPLDGAGTASPRRMGPCIPGWVSTPRHQGITCSKSGLLFKKFYLLKICLKNFVRIKFCRTFALGKRENSPFPRRNAFSNQLINLLLKGKNTLLTNQKKPAVIAGFFCCAPLRGNGGLVHPRTPTPIPSLTSHLLPGPVPCRCARHRPSSWPTRSAISHPGRGRRANSCTVYRVLGTFSR